MLRHYLIYIVLLVAVCTPRAYAQLSPGKLTGAHADLEGLRNCTKCHDLGNKVTNAKCLDCHQEIQSLMDQGRGYHSSKEVRRQDCARCHSEHHGRKFDMMRFDQEQFDHDLTGYELTGAHDRIDCRECHIPDFIADLDIRKREETFLGLEHDCIACHDDVHQNTLSTNDCASCHSTEEFAPAEYFDHDDTDYPLIGKHIEVDCIECHPIETRDGAEFQVFTGMAFDNCVACHEDVHDNVLGSDCKQCHNEQSFTSTRTLRRFNHNQTNFPLNGAHQQVNCADCHNMELELSQLFQDQLGIANNDCVSCHEDIHDNKLGTNCAECHNEQSFKSVGTDEFNHNLTNFPLLGQHQSVDCAQCHSENKTDPVAHQTCVTCHEDYHQGEFYADGVGPDCAACHSEQGFSGSTYTIEQHNASQFPLDGGHLATPCFACHLDEKEDRWKFRDIGQRCVDCHEDVHQGYISADYYPNQDCAQCHLTDNWLDNHFDHDLTAYSLLGKHAEVTCRACHIPDENFVVNRYEGFLNTPNTCWECHSEDNSHEDQFLENGASDCAQCHNQEGWLIAEFNHDETNFKLEGAHVRVDCAQCHQPYQATSGNIITQYKFKSFECVDCHQ